MALEIHKPPLQSQKEPHSSEAATELAREELQYITRQGAGERLGHPHATQGDTVSSRGSSSTKPVDLHHN